MIYTGGHGTALIPKVLSNMLVAVNIVAAGEALMIGKLIYFNGDITARSFSIALQPRRRVWT